MRRKVLIGIFLMIFGLFSSLMLFSVAPRDAVGQLLFVGLGIMLFALSQVFLPEFYHKLLPVGAIATFLLLIVTLLLGKISHGAMRWLPVGPFHLQVSEFTKPVLVLLLATFVAGHPLTTHRRILVYFFLSALFLLPVLLQPDLGSTLVLGAIAFGVAFFTIRKIQLIVPWILFLSFVAIFAWNFLLYGYQKDRLSSFLGGNGSASYNASQSFVTVGSGKLLGRGYGHGVQSQLRFLPEFHTDFFFASVAEELGLTGVTVMLCLYMAFFALLLHVPRRSSFVGSVSMTVFVLALFLQMAINIMMNIKLFPITGIPLPLLSSGGSSFLSICLGLGVITRISDD